MTRDKIYRQDAIDAILSEPYNEPRYPQWYAEKIRKLPSAEPERKTEHWIIHKDWLDEGLCGYECPKCSRCYDYPMNFCGFCGSPMEVEHD